MRREFEEMVEKGRWPGFVACAFTGEGSRLDKCVLTAARGKADLGRAAGTMGADTICRLYSMTKAFIGIGIVRLCERGLLRLDDPIYKHLPEPVASRFRVPRVALKNPETTEPARSPITVRQLLTHTSGMGSDIAPGLDALTRKRGRWERIYEGLTTSVDEGRIHNLSQFVEALSELPLWQHPGREFYYSYGYDVLGYLIETISGITLDKFKTHECHFQDDNF